jgi:hypothetical protein
VRSKFEQQGADASVMSPAEAVKFVAAEIEKWDGIIAKAGIPKL